MASVTAWLHFTNGEQAGANIEVDDDWPDALNQAVVECASLLLRAMVARRQMCEGDK